MYKVIRLLEKVPRGVFQEQIVWRETRTISRDTDTLYLDVSTSPGSSQRGLVHSTDRVKGPTGIFSGRWIQGVYIVELLLQSSFGLFHSGFPPICTSRMQLQMSSGYDKIETTSCTRETDRATTYNSKSVSIFMEEMGRITGIRDSCVFSHTQWTWSR